MRDSELESRLLALSRPLRAAILDFAAPDSCIMSSYVGLQVLARLGIRAEPMTVTLSVFNQAFADKFSEYGHWPQDQTEAVRWSEENGAWAVTAGTPEGNGRVAAPGTWAGHLVLIVEKRYLWDLSIDQVNRPDHGINIPMPVVRRIDHQRFEQCQPLVITGHGVVLAYKARPGETGYRDATNWGDDRFAELIQIRMRQNMAALLKAAETGVPRWAM